MNRMDLTCAECGAQIGKTEKLNEALVNRALGVLQEDGLYAFFLFLTAQNKKEASAIQDQIAGLLGQFFTGFNAAIGEKPADLLEVVRNQLTSDLGMLFLARDLVERTLVYARYHLKAKGEG